MTDLVHAVLNSRPVSAVYNRVPERVQALAVNGYVIAHPNVSWRRWSRAPEEFVATFFANEEEYESFRSEFWGGRIVDICREAGERVDDPKEIYDAHRDECERIYALVRKLQPETVVETGVYHGVSTASILLALAENDRGTLHSIDAASARVADADAAVEGDPSGAGTEAVSADGGADRFFARGRPSCSEPIDPALPPEFEPGWIVPDDLRDRWELTVGTSQRTLPALLGEVGEIDLFHHDSEHSTSGMLFEFELAWDRLRSGGVLLSCHVDWNDAFETFVDERPCEHGLMTHTFYPASEFTTPCSSGYAIKP